ncbi:MAG: gliding motility-associated C-terminal domain-containing protein [Ferruginibacter sp.]
MKIFHKNNILFLLLVISMHANNLYGQVCDTRYSQVGIKGKTYEALKKIVATKGNEIITTGELADYNKAAHIAKFSAKGNLLWSYFYSVDYFSFYYKDFFNHVRFNDIVTTADGGFIAAGSVSEYNDKAGGFKDTLALLSKIDKYGSPVWTRIFRSDAATEVATIANISFSSVIETAAGDIVAYMATDNGKKKFEGTHSYDKIVCLDASGKLKWKTLLFTGLFDAGGLGLNYKRAITEAADHSIVVARAIHKTGTYATGFSVLPGNIHFLSLDNITGKIKWETNYAYPVPAGDEAYTPEMLAAKQLPGGKFSFITNLYVPAGAALLKKAVQVIVSNTGTVEQVFSFGFADGSNCYAIDATNEEHVQALLLNNNGKRSVIKTGDNGSISLAKGYNNHDAEMSAAVLAAGSKGLYIHATKNNSFNSEIIITDAGGNIDCAAYDVSVVTGKGLLTAAEEKIFTDLDFNYTADRFGELGHPLKKESYQMQQDMICTQVNNCCYDKIDTANIINITMCEGKSFMLPDNSVIRDSGLYYVTFKTSFGCDSTRFFKVKTDKNVSALSLGNDTCLTGQQAITLKATAGFKTYLWMNHTPATSNEYKIIAPGNYFVSVNNTCGSKTDSIQIFELCDYPVYMPTAFTPNSNNLNDVFRIAPANKNRLISLRIYDRWGKLVFKTSDAAAGWDGTYKNEPLSAGAYLYIVDMMGLSGKRISQKGYVMLLR